jgi:hypothetical protein
MSFSMTPDAIRNRTKTVTRRLGWWDLKPGTLLCAVEKSPRNLRKGEALERLATLRVVHVEREPLSWIDQDECRKEGFPDFSPSDFAAMFCDAMACTYEAEVNRIEFEYVDGDS